MISFSIAATEPMLAEPLIADTEKRLYPESKPLWVSDGLDSYRKALFQRHNVIRTFPRTGKRGRPRRPKIVACPSLRYGQVVKNRNTRGHLVSVTKRAVFGEVPLESIKTVYIERHNLNLRHENRRLTRKTIAFSKEASWLEAQMHLYQATFNFVRSHRGLVQRIRGAKSEQACSLKWRKRTPAMAARLTDHKWSLREFMSFKAFINH